jgi:HTH-type transcriptional regulator/antitoxin HigA
MVIRNNFKPPPEGSPGEIIHAWLDSRNATRLQLAETMGCSLNLVNQVIRAESALTVHVAVQLEWATGLNAVELLTVEARYRVKLEKKRVIAAGGREAVWTGRQGRPSNGQTARPRTYVPVAERGD